MSKVFLSAGHSKSDPGAVAGGTTEHAEVQKIVDAAAGKFQKTGAEIVVAPENLSLREKILWINARADKSDFAIEIHLNAAGNPAANGVEVWFCAGKTTEKSVAEYLAGALSSRLLMKNNGAKPDTENRHGRLGFVRDTICHAFLFECGFLTNPTDLQKFRTRGKNALFETLVDLFLGGNPLLNPEKAWPFRDTFPADFFFSAVKKAKKKGILTKKPLFYPNKNITRGEVLTILNRLSLFD